MPEKNELPEGWVETPLKNVLKINYGKGLKKSDRKGTNFNVYGSNGIVGTHHEAITNGPTIIIGRKGSVGEINYSPEPCWPIDTTYYIDKFSGLDVSFVFNLLKTLQLSKFDTSTAIPGINRNDIYSQEIPLPPLPEQHRIVSAIEAIFSRLDAAEARLERVPEIMKHFRQSVLAAACDGRLTEDWRAENQNGWTSSKIKDLFEYWGGATPSTANKSFWNGNIPWISSKDMKSWKISKGELFITDKALENSRLRICPVNSVLVVVRSGILRHTLPVAITESEVVINQDLKAFYNPDNDLDNWLALFLKAKSPEILLNNRKDGTTVQSIKFDDLKNLDLLIPPKEEQHEIVRRVDALFALADKIEKQAASAKERTEKLRQSVLAQAFSGRLVETEAEIAGREGRSYESAGEMLERIRKTS